MSIPARLEKLIKTEKQRHFPKDFMVGWKDYETWEDAMVGQSGPAQRTFAITEEDILDYNKACGETDPLMVDPEYARKNSPTGELLQHPVFVTTIAFYSLGEKGIGSWIPHAGRSESGTAHRISRAVPLRRDDHHDSDDVSEIHSARQALSPDFARLP